MGGFSMGAWCKIPLYSFHYYWFSVNNPLNELCGEGMGAARNLCKDY